MMKTVRKKIEWMRIRRAEAGFTLLEMLLVVGLTASLSVGLLDITQQWLNNRLADNAGQHLKDLSESVEEYLLTEDFATLSDGEINTALETAFPTISLTSPLRRDYTVYLRKTTGANARLEALIYTSGVEIAPEVLTKAARAAGLNGGFASTFTPGENRNRAVSAYGVWGVDMAAYNAADTVSAGAEGGHLVAYVPVMQQNKTAGPYLYRTDDCNGNGIPGEPADIACNTMFANIDMNDNDILNANNVTSDNMVVYGTANTDTLNVTGDTTIDGTMSVAGQSTFNQNVTITAGTLTVSNGDINAPSATVTAETGEVTDLSVTNTITTDSITADSGLQVTGGGIALTENLNISGSNISVDINGAMTLGQLNVTTLNTDTLSTQNFEATGNVNVNGDMAVDTVNTDSLITDTSCIDGTRYPGETPC